MGPKWTFVILLIVYPSKVAEAQGEGNQIFSVVYPYIVNL